ncbi:hypothetical protein EVAR_82218_1 [Eumeta japonica]|uniref:Uncharacterized protein n=1 Tax=Eumeta variegata TaxID=151549 RepID=A0A4C1W6Q6_EUMVA|nr:hypothetical protein EVAR_82218_1 [Eumeta japonica]
MHRDRDHKAYRRRFIGFPTKRNTVKSVSTRKLRGRLFYGGNLRARRNGSGMGRAPLFFLRRCPYAETLSRYESPDCGTKRGNYACAVTPIQPMPPRGELLN